MCQPCECDYAKMSEEKANYMASKIKNIALENMQLVEDEYTLYTASGQVAFAAAFIYMDIYTNPTFDFSSGQKVKFEGTAWGLGLSGGQAWMAAAFTVSPSELIGDVSFSFVTGALETEINWWRGDQYLGSAFGATLGVGVAAGGGGGNFSNA